VRIIRFLVLASGLCMAPAAQAAVCDYTCNILGLTERISEVEASIKARIAESEQNIIQAIKGIGEQIAGTIEKQSAQQKQLSEGELLHKTKVDAYNQVVQADDYYTSPAATPPNVCGQMQTAELTAGNADDAALSAKATTYGKVSRTLYTPSAAAESGKMYGARLQKYCSAQDAARKRCSVSNEAMQNADVMASTLLTPNAGMTYSPEEYGAASQFINNAVDPFPTEMLPKTFDSSPQGRAFMLAQMAESAQLSVAQHSMSSILESRRASADLSARSGNPGQNLSAMGLMKKFAEERFLGTGWLAGLNDIGLLRQIAIMLSFRNWMDYQSYVQMERMETVLATQLAISAKQYNQPRIEQSRSAALSIRTSSGTTEPR
jgi:hypothetical protein